MPTSIQCTACNSVQNNSKKLNLKHSPSHLKGLQSLLIPGRQSIHEMSVERKGTMKRNRRKRKNVTNELTRRLGCTIGTFRCTSPPPRGGAPRMTIFSSRSSTGTPNCLSSGRVVVRKVSTLGSLLSFVMPAINHFFLNTKILHSGRGHPSTTANYTQQNRQCT
jgi:hypothetical protein